LIKNRYKICNIQFIGGVSTAEDLTVLHEKPDNSDLFELDEKSLPKAKNEENEIEKSWLNSQISKFYVILALSESGFDFTESSSNSGDSISNYNSISRDNSLLPISSGNQRNVSLFDLNFKLFKNYKYSF
jgi:hypothetical protein